jgi:hypothetical protein
MQYVEYCVNDLHYSRSCKSDVIRVAHILLVIFTLMVLDRADVYNLVAHSLGQKDEAQTLSAGEAVMEKRPKANGGTKSKLFKSKTVLRPQSVSYKNDCKRATDL